MKLIILWLLLYNITNINCDPNLKTRKPNFLDLDLANVDTKEFNLIKSSGEPEAYKISTKNDKTINAVKIKDNVVWSRKNSECVGVTIYKMEGDLLFVFNIVEGELRYNLHYYKEDTVESIGVIEFLALLNNKMRPEDSTVTLNLSDEYSKVFYKYKIKRNNDMTYEVYQSDEEYEIDTIVDEPVGINDGEVKTELTPTVSVTAGGKPAETPINKGTKAKKDDEPTDKALKDKTDSKDPKQSSSDVSKGKSDSKPDKSKDEDKGKKDSKDPKSDADGSKGTKPADGKDSAKTADAKANLLAETPQPTPQVDKKFIWKSHSNAKLGKKVEVYKNEGRYQFILITLKDKTVIHLKRSKSDKPPVSSEKAVSGESPEKPATATENSTNSKANVVDEHHDPGFTLGSGWKVITEEKFDTLKGHKGLKMFDSIQEPKNKVVNGKLVKIPVREDVIDLNRHNTFCTYTSNKVMDNLFVVIIPQNPKRLKKLVFGHHTGGSANVDDESSSDEDLGSIDGVKIRPPLTVGDAIKRTEKPEGEPQAAKSEKDNESSQGDQKGAEGQADKSEGTKSKAKPSDHKHTSKTKTTVPTPRSSLESLTEEKKKPRVDLIYDFGLHAKNEQWTSVIILYTKLSNNVHYVEVIASKNGSRVPNMHFKYSTTEGITWKRGADGWKNVIIQQSKKPSASSKASVPAHASAQEEGKWLRFSQCAYHKSLTTDIKKTVHYLEYFGIDGLKAGDAVTELPEYVKKRIESTPTDPDTDESNDTGTDNSVTGDTETNKTTSDDSDGSDEGEKESRDENQSTSTPTAPEEQPDKNDPLVDVNVIQKDGVDVNSGDVSEDIDDSSNGNTVPLLYIEDKEKDEEGDGFRLSGMAMLFLLSVSIVALT